MLFGGCQRCASLGFAAWEPGRSRLRTRDGVRAGSAARPSPILFGLSFGVVAHATGFGSRAPAVVMSARRPSRVRRSRVTSVLGAGGMGQRRSSRPSAQPLRRDRRRPSCLPRRREPTSGRVAGHRRRGVGRLRAPWTSSGPSRRHGLPFYVSPSAADAGMIVGGVLGEPDALGLDAAFAGALPRARAPYLASPLASGGRLAAAITLGADAVHAGGVPIVAAPQPASLGAPPTTGSWLVVAVVGVATVRLEGGRPWCSLAGVTCRRACKRSWELLFFVCAPRRRYADLRRRTRRSASTRVMWPRGCPLVGRFPPAGAHHRRAWSWPRPRPRLSASLPRVWASLRVAAPGDCGQLADGLGRGGSRARSRGAKA